MFYKSHYYYVRVCVVWIPKKKKSDCRCKHAYYILCTYGQPAVQYVHNNNNSDKMNIIFVRGNNVETDQFD